MNETVVPLSGDKARRYVALPSGEWFCPSSFVEFDALGIVYPHANEAIIRGGGMAEIMTRFQCVIFGSTVRLEFGERPEDRFLLGVVADWPGCYGLASAGQAIPPTSLFRPIKLWAGDKMRVVIEPNEATKEEAREFGEAWVSLSGPIRPSEDAGG